MFDEHKEQGSKRPWTSSEEFLQQVVANNTMETTSVNKKRKLIPRSGTIDSTDARRGVQLVRDEESHVRKNKYSKRSNNTSPLVYNNVPAAVAGREKEKSSHQSPAKTPEIEIDKNSTTVVPLMSPVLPPLPITTTDVSRKACPDTSKGFYDHKKQSFLPLNDNRNKAAGEVVEEQEKEEAPKINTPATFTIPCTSAAGYTAIPVGFQKFDDNDEIHAPISAKKKPEPTNKSTSRERKKRAPNKSFEEHFQDLMQFKAEFGHCNAPTTLSEENKYLSLGRWCNRIRISYKAQKLGKQKKLSCSLTERNIRRLEDAGFVWAHLEKKFTFDERYEKLVEFKNQNGHINVPASGDPELETLRRWIKNMRIAYKARTHGQGVNPNNKNQYTYALTEENIACLDSLGFDWTPKEKHSFDEMFRDMMVFKWEHGHCNVPTTPVPSNKHLVLGRWCQQVRYAYKAGGMNDHNFPFKLSNNDIKRLEIIGFNWDVQDVMKTESAPPKSS